MICLYEYNETNFTFNGLGTLEPIECSFSPYINSPWSLKLTLPVDPEGKSNLIKNERLIKVTDIDCIEEQTSDYQLFRICDFRKEQNLVYVTALPVGLDARFDTFVDFLKLYDKTAYSALTDINNISNKYTVSGTGYIDSIYRSTEFVNANLISILNGDKGFVTTWDGEICYDNYNLKVNHRLGTNATPIDVRYGKNITGMSYDLDASNVITRLYPKAKSGEILNAVAAYKLSNERYVDAENASDYPIPHIYYVETPSSLVQLSNDGSPEYEMSSELYGTIQAYTANWLKEALLEDSVYDGLLKEIELDWILNNYALKVENDGVEGIVQYMWRKVITSNDHNIISTTVRNLIYNAMKAGFDDVLKNTNSSFYIGTAEKDWLTGTGGPFYSYVWDTNGDYKLDAPTGEYAWAYTSSKWRQVNDQGYATGVTDSATWKWYKKKPNNFKFYGNKKKSRKLHDQWWKINDVWYYFEGNGKGRKGSWLNSTYYEYFDDAQIDWSGSDHTLYEILIPVCLEGEADLFELLYRQMTNYCYYLFQTDMLSYPTIKLDINMIDLSRTEEYKDFSYLERIHLGNEVRVYNPRLMSEPSTVRVIGLTYDVLRKMNTEIKIGITESSVINLLNSIGQDKETKYVAGEGITIENNVISVNPPETPYMTNFLVDGESVVRNHVGYFDTEGLGVSTVKVLNGEDTPDHEDGDDEDIYLLMANMDDNDFIVTGTKGYGTMDDAVITKVAKNKFTAELSGIPTAYAYSPEDEIAIWLGGLVEGETYTANIKFKFGSSTGFYSGDNVITLGELGSGNTTVITLARNRNEQTFSVQFTAGQFNTIYFSFHSVTDNVRMTATCTCEITGTLKKIKNVYYKIGEDWYKDNNVRNVIDKDGNTLVDENGVAQIPESASSVAELTDVELTNLADKEILEWDANAEKWKNVANSGGGGGGTVMVRELEFIGNINFSRNTITDIPLNGHTLDEFDYFYVDVTWAYLGTSYSKVLNISEIQTDIYYTESDFYSSSIVGNFYFRKWSNTRATIHTPLSNVDSNGFTARLYGGKYKDYIAPIIYSEEEREVGVWIDNKPLYAKTYPLSNGVYISGSGTVLTSYIDNQSVIDKFIQATGIYTSQPNACASSVFLARSSGAIKAWCSEAGTFDYINIFYTKTTDVAGSGKYNTLGVPTVHYDASEQVIGTWFGKPLYQKTIVQNNIDVGYDSTVHSEIAHGVANFKEAHSLTIGCPILGICSGNTLWNANATIIASFRVNSTNIYATGGSNHFGAVSDRYWYFTITYTKTTD